MGSVHGLTVTVNVVEEREREGQSGREGEKESE